jgi:DNA-binding CsgD family transcriptional regulator
MAAPEPVPDASYDDLENRPSTDSIIVAIELDDPALADRLAAALWEAPGVRIAADGERPDFVLTRPPPDDAVAACDLALTPREVDVLTLLSEGASNKEIARRLGISVHTAKFHVSSLLDKLDATGRTDAVTHAARLGVLRL